MTKPKNKKKTSLYNLIKIENIKTVFTSSFSSLKEFYTRYKSNKKIIISLVVLIVLICGSFYYFYQPKLNNIEKKLKDNDKRLVSIVSSLSKLMILPAGETPVLFEISDPNTLVGKDQFFKGAEKGDVLLIYQKSGKAIIYNPNKDIIVNVGPIVSN